ncbi:hypothetical protein L207DRAFT_508607 [Hyaloscypha variabilis F]|uniref:Uncharacterized protein n=1 Tax=Hyaloscypha variabilis (strain UAMH 11265 / GT02V1 / F) TaxID=1149755 RepID=A0A2J6S505_HYAVF|nr:hypothetical protein L207DRAFT_508607 [Hyaloscypha variabilis F]
MLRLGDVEEDYFCGWRLGEFRSRCDCCCCWSAGSARLFHAPEDCSPPGLLPVLRVSRLRGHQLPNASDARQKTLQKTGEEALHPFFFGV